VVGGARSDGGDDNLFDAFVWKAPPEPADWSRRYKQNVGLLRSGEIVNVALVAHRLKARAGEKGLSRGEQRMLERARSILECEAFLGVADGWEGDEPGDGGSDVREPRHPEPTGGPGPQALDSSQGRDDRRHHLDQQ